MSCSNCEKSKPILACISTLTVGTISNISTAVYVYLRNNTTGRTYRYSTTSSGAGVVSVDISAQQHIPEHDYELWVTLASATNTEEKLTLTISSETMTCVSLSFVRAFNNTDTLVSGNQTLTLE